MSIGSYLYTKLKNYLPHAPTANQDELMRGLADFIADPCNDTVFLLTGYAGTGKTTVVAALVKLLTEIGIESLLMAPTGRAAKVLSNYAEQSAYTIHKKIYRQKTPNDVISPFVLAPNEYPDTIFIVDEASMISNENQGSVFGSGQLLNDLLQFVRRLQAHHGGRPGTIAAGALTAKSGAGSGGDGATGTNTTQQPHRRGAAGSPKRHTAQRHPAAQQY